LFQLQIGEAGSSSLSPTIVGSPQLVFGYPQDMPQSVAPEELALQKELNVLEIPHEQVYA
jgi:hypothetical protein